MPSDTPPNDEEEAELWGRALARLRRMAGITQAEAAAKYAEILGQEDFSPQAWSLYENGKRQAIFMPETQAQLAEAVGASAEDLKAARAQVQLSRVSRALGVREQAATFGRIIEEPRTQLTWSLPEGDVALSYPATVSEQSKQDIADFLKIFLRRFERPAS